LEVDRKRRQIIKPSSPGPATETDLRRSKQ
jgi:hypothetical protein